ncbi:FkbM family methyltransferase [Blastopirellula sp. JC732]|uniref:FkbM family methyltransferase n=1 Tax=Blastopirellula sediminis TaxID=2894196 RepID=A0A9X1MQ91_9BACT|nr:FkbM family methyltransferase [Blastopirellula sediminis]MCC9606312.1 FkbM family methyltransferase [Blastopirellula sediminis]MCC9630390.1 FkbM family methyltransferase [Blastopirellula sediminis]
MAHTASPSTFKRVIRWFSGKQTPALAPAPSESEAAVTISERALKIRHFKMDVYEKLAATTILSQLPPLLDRSKNAIDVGGNVGHIAYFLAQHCKQVYTFEAVEVVYERLKSVSQLADNIVVQHLAISDFCGEADFFVDHERLSNSGLHDVSAVSTSFKPSTQFRSTKTPVKSIDSLGIEDVGFIKVDVEGSELDVLRGAEATLARYSPDLLLEIYEPFSKYPVADVFRFGFERGYNCYHYDNSSESGSLVRVVDEMDGVRAVQERHQLHDGDFLFTKKSI